MADDGVWTMMNTYCFIGVIARFKKGSGWRSSAVIQGEKAIGSLAEGDEAGRPIPELGAPKQTDSLFDAQKYLSDEIDLWLFGEEEEEHDFFSSTTATSVSEMFLSDCVMDLFVCLFAIMLMCGKSTVQKSTKSSLPNGGGLLEQALRQVFQINGGIDGKYYTPIIQEDKLSVKRTWCWAQYCWRKGSGLLDASDMVNDDVSGKCFQSTPAVSEGSKQDLTSDQVSICSGR
ncbi:hypothetical protein Acr_00g0083470 [Actinidia rufa]|uniref:Uncharacterized protein n=1 Tax=Actinidia rufa TaxID=165716 RepID=A0A7J0DVJ1_9ERIC|nr:hypothetical protein Acr_00g0083470 [Actinidia rufa]